MTRPIVRWHRRAGLLSCLWVSGCLGADESDGSPRYSVVDSSGVAIVTSHAPGWDEGDAWEFDPSPTVSLGGADSDIGHLIWLAQNGARLSDGRIALLTGGRDAPRILILSRQGELDATMGRSGQGPGEFIEPGRFQVLPGDTLVVWEAAFGRVSSFAPDGTLLGIRHLDLARIQEVARFAGRAQGVVLPLPDGSFITNAPAALQPDREVPIGEIARRPRAWTRVDREYSADTLGVYGGPERVGYERPDGGRTVLFPLASARSRVQMASDPLRIYISQGDERGIDVFDDAGRLVRVIRRSTAAMPMAPEDWRTMLYGSFDGSNLPPDRWTEAETFYRTNLPEQTHFPVMSSFFADRLGYLWVMDGGVGPDWTWSIFDPEGRWLGRMSLPLAFASVLDIGEDYVLGRQWDDMMVESVHEYRLDRGGSGPRLP